LLPKTPKPLAFLIVYNLMLGKQSYFPLSKNGVPLR